MQRNNGFRLVYIPLALAAWGIYTNLTPQKQLPTPEPVPTHRQNMAASIPPDSTTCTYIFETIDAEQ